MLMRSKSFCYAGLRRMARDPQWMSGKVVEACNLLPPGAEKENRVVKLIKVDISGNHVSYEPGESLCSSYMTLLTSIP